MRFIFGVVKFTDMKKILSIVKVGLAVLIVALTGVACSKTKVVLLVSSVSITPASLRLDEGTTAELVAEMMPENATDKTIKWESSASDIVSVDKNGKISALKAGVAIVTAKSLGSGVTGTCEVEVLKNLASDEFDPGFAKALQEKGYISNVDKITKYDVSEIVELSMNDGFYNSEANKLTSLSGIEYFTNLEVLDVRGNEITEINLSKNLSLKELLVSKNKLTSLDVSNNADLESLSAYDNNLKTLEIGKKTSLKVLAAYKNKLTSIDVSQCEALTCLVIEKNNLQFVDISKNEQLITLSCAENPGNDKNVFELYIKTGFVSQDVLFPADGKTWSFDGNTVTLKYIYR